MTTYYVKTDGDDGLDGLSEANAWLTIAHAQSNIIANDEVSIAAGTYNETSAFIFNPPAGTIWTGADINDPALTKLFTIHYDNDFTITNDNIEIHGCYVGLNTYPTIILNNTGFKMVDCLCGCQLYGLVTDLVLDNVASNSALLLDFTSPYTSINGTFTDVVYPHGMGALFKLSGAGNTVTRFQDYSSLTNYINCSDVNMSDCLFYGLTMWGSTGNSVNLLEVTNKITVLTDASANGQQTITNCKDIAKATVQAGASLTLSWYLKKFYESSNDAWTTIDTSGQPAITIAGGSTDITFTERDFAATPNADIDVLIESWGLTGDQNKSWEVSATGDRTIAFKLGDMLADTSYNLYANGTYAANAVSNASGVLTFPNYTQAYSTVTFSTAIGTPPVPLLTHDEIRTAAITTLQANTDINAAIKTWLRYLINTGQITYPAIYIGEIRQPFDGECGSEVQHTSLAKPMEITVGVLSNTNEGAVTELGTLYELVFDTFKDTPELGLTNFNIHSISQITTKPIPKCGRSVIRAELTLIATWVRSND